MLRLPILSRKSVGREEMRVFIMSCVCAVAIAALGGLILNYVQEPASVAFATEAVRL